MKKLLVHWQLLGNCIGITVASQGVLVGKFKGGDAAKDFSNVDEMWDLATVAVDCTLFTV